MLDLAIKCERPAFIAAKHYLGALCKRGHGFELTGLSVRHIGHGNCVECCRLGAREWKARNPERHAASTKRRDVQRVISGETKNRRNKYPFAVHLGGIKDRARKRGLPEDLCPDDLRRMWLEQDGKCWWTGRPMDFFIGAARHPLRPSLDRIVPALGYTNGNVVWSSNFANRARGDLPAAEFADLMLSLDFDAAYRKWAIAAPTS